MLAAKYRFKNALYGLTPGSFGYMRRLRAEQVKDYIHERDKHPVRDRHNGTTGWQSDGADIQRREYETYEEYQTHQKQKFTEILKINGGFGNRTVLTWRMRFYRRFRHLTNLLSSDATIICLGARQGTEVEVLHDIGFSNAYGIDLNPGPNNPFVRTGDFMNLQEATDSVDLLYTNCLDHTFDLTKFFAENARVLKQGGYALYDLPRYSDTRSPGAFEAIGWDDEQTVIDSMQNHFEKRVLSAVERKWHWVLWQHPRP